MTRISKPPKERRKEILDAALELFLKNGYENTSVADIVARLGVAQGLFYYYFKSKEEVYRAALEQYTDDFALRLTALILEDRPFIGKIEMVVKTFEVMFAESEHALMDTLHLAEHIELDNRLSLHVAQLLIEPVTGVLREMNDKGFTRLENTETTATFLIFGIYGLLHGDLEHIHRIAFDTAEVVRLTARVLGVSEEDLKRI
ncbi:transcriptional regulator, TetR family [Sporobacter termitidis DSM 10068]|uniref:Transcriptional regulator, TetR family n=1 Tax=Sporobacter termitidis DSM 10068 TaxID=1123282 RepID=A0A1M5Z0T2_9FIRM|nr:TetR/AcrR family transcriptional regulator [Sporobacter termitidis]SHI17885.1 transcriptional regulator, TetR family [Sporobacter termitidis DSM 10068]